MLTNNSKNEINDEQIKNKIDILKVIVSSVGNDLTGEILKIKKSNTELLELKEKAVKLISDLEQQRLTYQNKNTELLQTLIKDLKI